MLRQALLGFDQLCRFSLVAMGHVKLCSVSAVESSWVLLSSVPLRQGGRGVFRFVRMGSVEAVVMSSVKLRYVQFG